MRRGRRIGHGCNNLVKISEIDAWKATGLEQVPLDMRIIAATQIQLRSIAEGGEVKMHLVAPQALHRPLGENRPGQDYLPNK